MGKIRKIKVEGIMEERDVEREMNVPTTASVSSKKVGMIREAPAFGQALVPMKTEPKQTLQRRSTYSGRPSTAKTEGAVTSSSAVPQRELKRTFSEGGAAKIGGSSQTRRTSVLTGPQPLPGWLVKKKMSQDWIQPEKKREALQRRAQSENEPGYEPRSGRHRHPHQAVREKEMTLYRTGVNPREISSDSD